MRRIHNVKGVSYLVLLVISAILILVFASIVSVITGKAAYVTPKEYRCISSIMTSSFLMKTATTELKPEILCPSRDVELKYGEASMKHQLAEELRQCWKAFGRGKYELFNGEGLFCHVCAYVHSEKDVVLGNLTSYMFDHYIPRAKITYADFLLGYESSTTDLINEGQINIMRESLSSSSLDLSGNNEGQIIFVYARGSDWITKLNNFVGGTTNLVIGAATLGGAATAIVLSAVGAPVTITVVVIGAVVSASTAVWNVFVNDDVEHASMILLIDSDKPDILSNLSCETLPVSQRKK